MGLGAARRNVAACAGWIILAPALLVQPAWGQTRTALAIDSGETAVPPAVQDAVPRPELVYSTVISLPGARWLHVRFGEVLLSGDEAEGNRAWLELSSLEDGGTQVLTAEDVERWRHASAYFNGDAVELRLFAYAGTAPCRVTVREIISDGAGGADGEGGLASICGGTDDRALSFDPRIGRGFTESGEPRCTAWIFNDCARCLMTAGHCRAQQLTQIHFNVPLSDPDGTENFPPPSDQYVIDPNSWSFLNAGVGNDYAHFGCFPNPNTGLTPFEAAQAAIPLLLTPPAPSGQPLRVTGYGTIEPPAPPPPLSWNRVQSTHVGPYSSQNGNVLGHRVDTTGGNSGSPMVLEGSGQAIGIHTHAGCDISGGENQGTSLANAFFRESLKTPKGVCTPELVLQDPRPGRLYYGDGPAPQETLWPVPLTFAVVANRPQLDLEASDGRSFGSMVDFTIDGVTVVDNAPLGDLWHGVLSPSGGEKTLVTRIFNPWGDAVRTLTSGVQFFKLGDPGPTQPRGGWLAGTAITLANMTPKPVESLEVGDQVQVVSLLDGSVSYARVTKLHVSPAQSPHVVINGAWRVAPGYLVQAVIAGEGSVPKLARAGSLKIGDKLVNLTGGTINITQLQTVATAATFYGFELGVSTRVCTPYYAYLANGARAYLPPGQLVSMAAPLLYEYELTDIGALGAANHFARAINNAGTVAGTSGGQALRWSYEDGLTNLGPGEAWGINAGNVVVGISNARATLWQSDGAKVDLGPGAAYDINDAGIVVGTNGSQAVKWQNGQPTILGPGVAYGINANGDIVGQRSGQATLWPAAGGFINIGQGVAYDVNDELVVVGQTNGSAFRWQGGNTTLIAPGKAREVNASGVVVGEADAGFAFMWTPVEGLHFLNARIWGWSGWSTQAAHGINDTGFVVGNGTFDGAPRAFEARPTTLAFDVNANGVPDLCEVGGSDCNNNGIPDEQDIAQGFSADCNENLIPDECDIAAGISGDCNSNGVPDDCDIDNGLATDCNNNGVPDNCDVTQGNGADCNGNGLLDECDIQNGLEQDCNQNGVPDSCDLDAGTSADCNGNGIPDECDLDSGLAQDCNDNNVPDSCDLANGTSQDCNGNDKPDECDIAGGLAQDCNGNGVPDSCDLANGTSQDCNGNGKPDECDIAGGLAQDCNQNGVPDSCDLAQGTSTDCNANQVPDECDLESGQGADCNSNGVLDECDIQNGVAQDCNGNGVPDSCDLAGGTSQDCNNNNRPDECDIADGLVPDCNGNGVPDACDLANGTSQDCNGNGKPDECDIAGGLAQDCNLNGVPDSCDIANGDDGDCNLNGVPDSCDIEQGLAPDCNGNSVPDACDIAQGTSLDCNGNSVPDECDVAEGVPDCNLNGIPDSCDIANGVAQDCNLNGIPDSCDIAGGFSQDCNANGVPDSCDLANGTSQDCNGNGKPDECDIAGGFSQDCNGNGVPDSCDLANGTSQDCNGNGKPDECDIAGGFSQDCNGNGKPDECDIADGTPDCNGNGVPDSCDIAQGTSSDCNLNGIPDSCDIAGGAPDCNGNGIPDSCDIADGQSEDCNGNAIPDECDIAGGVMDCNGNGVPDSCDIASGTSDDCNGNAVPDECDLANGEPDCNGNGVLDACDISGGSSTDLNGDGIPDDCQDCNGNSIPDDLDIANGTSQDADGNGLPDECQVPDAPSDPQPADGASDVPVNVSLSALVSTAHDGAVDVTFFAFGVDALVQVDSESQWSQGTFQGTVTDGQGRLELAENTFDYGDGSHGDLTVSSGTIFDLPPNMQYQNVTIESNATLNTQGNTLRVAGTLFSLGTITDTVSGGNGGAAVDGGRGQDPKQNDNPPGPLQPQLGSCGGIGLPGAPGAGKGGAAGGSGGGGGGAQRNIGTNDADGGWNHLTPTDRRGRGGNGGKGGGAVRVYAVNLDNLGKIHANGFKGEDGRPGGDGQYFSGGGMDMAGGGGGGGAGGDGGNGGTVEIRYAQLLHAGIVQSIGGGGGAGGAGGAGRNVTIGVNGGSFFEGANGACGGGKGGRGEYRAGFSSQPGNTGSSGDTGSNGTVSLAQQIPGFTSSGFYTSAWLCPAVRATWNAAQVTANVPAGTSVGAAYSADGQTWYSNIASVPDSECLKFRLTLTTNDPNVTPKVDRVAITYTPHVVLAELADVPSGTRPSTPWPNLVPDQEYCWYVVADDLGGSAVSDVWCFVTGDGAACDGDLNLDGQRNQADLGILLADYGCNDGPGQCPGDINGDGATDQADLGILLAAYLTPCP